MGAAGSSVQLVGLTRWDPSADVDRSGALATIQVDTNQVLIIYI